MKNLFFTYLNLYPGKADVINAAIIEAKEDATMQGLTETETTALAEGYILAEL